jgi:CRISPR-associated protein Cas1
MDEIGPTDLKSILHSKRANIYYLQHCRVLVNGGRVEYAPDSGRGGNSVFPPRSCFARSR